MNNQHVLELKQLCQNSIEELLDEFPIQRYQIKDHLKIKDVSPPKREITKNDGCASGKIVPPCANANEKIKSFRMSLPAYQYRKEIEQCINENQVTLITGGTGCGKTTQVPQYILASARRNQLPVKIICTQPRRLPAIEIARRVAFERGEQLGETVGYHIRLERKTSAKTILTYCTSGVLLRMLPSTEMVGDVTHIILDEIHEREQITDYLLIALKEMIKTNKQLKILLMSATMESNLQSLTTFFEGSMVQHINIKSNLHHVEELYLSDILALTGYQSQRAMGSAYQPLSQMNSGAQQRSRSPDTFGTETVASKSSSFGACRARRDNLYKAQKHLDIALPNRPRFFHPYIIHELRESEYLRRDALVEQYLKSEKITLYSEICVDTSLTVCLINYLMDSPISGAILVFLPGMEDITLISERLGPPIETTKQPAICVLHSQMNSDQQQEAFRCVPDGYRKVILSTNIAEASVTIDDVVFVVDCGIVKQKVYDHSNRTTELKVTWIAKSNAVQRKGRAGRCRDGYCFRLYSQRDFLEFASVQLPEIKRLSIHDVVLHAKVFAPKNVSVREFLAMAPEPPSNEAIEHSFEFLEELGALCSSQWTGYYTQLSDGIDEPKLTELGEVLAHLPLDPQLARLLLFGIFLRCFSPIVTLVAALSYRDPYSATNRDDRSSANVARDEFGRRDFSDAIMLIRILNAYCKQPEGRKKIFCEMAYLNPAAMKMMVGIKTQLVQELRRFRLIPEEVTDCLLDSGLNRYSTSWPMIQAAIVAGSHVGIVKEGSKGRTIKIGESQIASLHPSCVMKRQFVNLERTTELCEKFASKKYLDPKIEFVAYQELVKISEGLTIKMVTAVPPLATFFFYGEIRTSKDMVSNFGLDEEIREDMEEVTIGKWPSYKGSFKVIQLLVKLRFKLMSHFSGMLKNRSNTETPELKKLLGCVEYVLSKDHKANDFDECDKNDLYYC